MTPKDFIKTWFASIDALNFDQLKNMIADNHSFQNPMTPKPGNKEMHMGMMQNMTSAFDGKHTLDVILAEGEWVCARGRWSGKHTGEFQGVAATGKNVEFSWIDVMHIVNDKVVEEYFELNPMSIMQQIGAVPT